MNQIILLTKFIFFRLILKGLKIFVASNKIRRIIKKLPFLKKKKKQNKKNKTK